MLARLFWASLYTVQPAECSYLQRYQDCVSRKPSQNLVILAPLKLSCVGRGYNKELDGWPAANILSREPLLLFFLFFLFFFLFGPIFILKCAFCKAYLSLIRPLDEKDKQTNKQNKHAFACKLNVGSKGEVRSWNQSLIQRRGECQVNCRFASL